MVTIRFYNYYVLPLIHYFFPSVPVYEPEIVYEPVPIYEPEIVYEQVYKPPLKVIPTHMPPQYQVYLDRKVEKTFEACGLIQDF